MKVKVTLTNSEGSKTLTTEREFNDAIAYFRVITTYGTEPFRTFKKTDKYAMLTRNVNANIDTLEFEVQDA